jgi:hypothetical protein
VFGGAVAIVQKTQSSLFQQQNLLSVFVSNSSGSNFTILFVNSSFVGCLAKTSSLSVRSGSTSAGGGAVYVHSSAIYNFTAKHSTFESNSVENNCGAKESITLSSGGALVVETPSSTESVVYISWCTFLKCSAVGAFLNTVAVQAGALAVASASIVSIEHSQFLNCSIQAALESSVLESGLDSLEFEGSGGAGASLSFARNISIIRCVFDATGGSDASETSSGLLILFSHSFPSHVHVQDSVMKGSQVLLGVYCANQLDFSAIVCPPEGLQLSVQNSSLIQVLPQNFSQDDFMIGNHVIALQRGVSSSFGRVLVQCENDGYAVLKNLSERLSILKYSCKPCLPFQVARSSNEVWIEDVASRVEAGVCVHLPDDTSNCPVGLSHCQTFVSVSQGFWTNIKLEGPEVIDKVQRCPDGYCGCGSRSCRVATELSVRKTSLCNHRRTGTLCGGCARGFTQSMDGVSCISNSDCIQNLWWVWMLSILGYALIGLIIVPVGRRGSGVLQSILFYFQIASFASTSSSSNFSSAILEYSQTQSFVAFRASACYAGDLSAYSATVARLIGPVFVFWFSLAWTWILQLLQPQFQKRNIVVEVSYSGTAVTSILFVFSITATVVFTLVECTSYTSGGVVFIDGTVACLDSRWKGLVFVAVLMSIFPVVFGAALLKNKLPESARAPLCHAYTERMFFWGSVALQFRFLMSLMQFLRVDYPSVVAFCRSMLSLGMSLMLVHFRPYKMQITFWVDVTCFVCLAAQFGLQALQSSFVDLDFSVFNHDTIRFVNSLSSVSTAVR